MKAITHRNPLGLQGLIDTRGMEDFYTDLKSAYGKFIACAATISLWSDYSGDGLYTYSGARIAKGMILKAIDSGGASIGETWPRLSDEQFILGGVTAGYRKQWKYRGHVYRNVVARKMRKGYEIGLKNKMVMASGFRSNARHPSSAIRIPVQRYAAWVEYGTSWMHPRPLFGPSREIYAKSVGPALYRIVKHSVKRVADKYKIKKVRSKTTTMPVSSIMGASTLKSADPNNDFGSMPIDNLLKNSRMGNSTVNLTKFCGVDGMNQIKLGDNKDLDDLAALEKKYAKTDKGFSVDKADLA